MHYNAVDVEGNTYTSNRNFIDKYTVLQAFENNKLDAITPEVNRLFGDNHYVVRTDVGFLEIMPKHVNKGNGLLHLAKYLGIGIDDVLAIGDGENDIPMLEQAGVAVVIENAADSIKKLGNFVTTNNNESGIATAFEKYVLN